MLQSRMGSLDMRWALWGKALLTALAFAQACSDQGPTNASCRVGSHRTGTATDSSVHWALVSSPTKQRLSGLALAGPSTGAAVGDSGTYLIYGGGSVWSPLNLVPWNNKDFYSVQETDSGSVWIAGDSGVVIFAPLRTGGWSQQTTTVLVTLFSVSRVANTSELFGVGTDRVIVHILDGLGNFAGPWSSQLSPVGTRCSTWEGRRTAPCSPSAREARRHGSTEPPGTPTRSASTSTSIPAPSSEIR